MFIRSTVGDGVNPLAVDPDPNVTFPPDDRLIRLPSASPLGGQWQAWLAAQGGSPTVELWLLIDFSGSSWWFRWNNAAIAVPVDQAVSFPTFSVPVDTASAFLRVTAVGGATRVLLGLTG
jgi:hypothetical protein